MEIFSTFFLSEIPTYDVRPPTIIYIIYIQFYFYEVMVYPIATDIRPARGISVTLPSYLILSYLTLLFTFVLTTEQ